MNVHSQHSGQRAPSPHTVVVRPHLDIPPSPRAQRRARHHQRLDRALNRIEDAGAAIARALNAVPAIIGELLALAVVVAAAWIVFRLTNGSV